jgi:hypothetical protein
MRVQISAICIVLTVAGALVAAQSSQRDTPSTTSIPTATTPTTTGTTPTTTAGSTAIPGASTTSTTRPPAEPAPLQLPPIGRTEPEAAAVPTRPNGQSPCPGNQASPAGAASSSQFPGVSASQLPRAGVSADAFVRPGVSAAQLAVLQPGARSAPCGPPRDVILYPDVGPPSRRVPPPGENEP